LTESGASLYNRHRPAVFADMVGQDHVARALGNALRSGRPAQGYLFSGPRGTGKTTTARILARCLNCQSFPAPTAEPCGTCDSCRRTGQPDWMDVVEVDAASSARRIDEMREWLETVRYAPVACRYRITIMDEAHQIQDQAASALLKTLEEPPPHLVVILCTTHPWEILGTIRSRLQHYVLRKPGLPALVKVLDRVARAEDIQTSESALDILARAADGSYRDALGLLDQIATYADNRVEASDALELLGAVARETIFELVDLMAGGDAAGGFELLETVLDGPVDPEQAMRGLVNHLRYLCLLQQGARPRDEWSFSPEEIARLQAQANQLPDAQVVRGLDLLSDAQLRIRHGGADPRLQLELVAARLARPALDASAGALAARVEALESAAPWRCRRRRPRRARRRWRTSCRPSSRLRFPRCPRGPRRRRTIRPARSWSWTSRTSTGSGRACSRRWSAMPRPRAGSSTAPARRRWTSGPWRSRSPARCAPRCWGSPSTASG
jgi:DNA polymerase-3 subunit gamma/tau